MQIVIDMPDDLKDKICNSTEEWAARYVAGWDMEIARIVRNGTPLPKGHGRLKDVDWIDDNCEVHYSDKDGSWCYAWRDIDNAQTIIEADKEAESE